MNIFLINYPKGDKKSAIGNNVVFDFADALLGRFIDRNREYKCVLATFLLMFPLTTFVK